MRKRILAAALCGVMLMGGVAGCGSSISTEAVSTGVTESSVEASVATEAGGESELLKSIKEKGYITIASSNDAPLCYQDINTGELAGIDIMIFNEVCKRMEIPEIKMKVIDFSNMLVELNNNSVDMVVDAMYIKDERLDVALFTDVWYQEGEAVVVKKGSEFTTKESLVNASMGAQPGTAFYETAEKWLDEGKIKELVGYENQSTLMTAVNTGKVDAAVTDGIVLAYTLSKDSNLDLEMLSPYEAEASGRIGAAVRFQDKAFLEEFNAVLNEMKEDGTLLQILKDFGLNEDYFVGVEDGKTANKQ
ncbi:MAG: amino acid ABC transporter substrate-binding protein [Lachnospiraceae bacterium]|nr:amino acid ABC transporter substrate-binding protein [Lachnospiraceae bacterium]